MLTLLNGICEFVLVCFHALLVSLFIYLPLREVCWGSVALILSLVLGFVIYPVSKKVISFCLCVIGIGSILSD